LPVTLQDQAYNPEAYSSTAWRNIAQQSPLSTSIERALDVGLDAPPTFVWSPSSLAGTRPWDNSDFMLSHAGGARTLVRRRAL